MTVPSNWSMLQLLEMWERRGLRLMPGGDAEQLPRWLAEHPVTQTGSMLSPVESTAVNAEGRSVSRASELPQAASQAATTAALIMKSDTVGDRAGAWESPALPMPERAAALAEQSACVANCVRCPELVASRTQTVYGVGNPGARLVFIGEGPGYHEDRCGEPFVGAAGELLDKIIAAMTLSRSDVYIMNAVKCRPENNRNPTDDEIANCQDWFLQQLEILQPQYIVCLGIVAAKAVLKTASTIGRLRGRFYPWRGAQVRVTYHPAYLLRTPEAKKLTWEDIQAVMAAMGLKR